jgi:hypothetical protein
MCIVGEELALDDEKANHVVQSINDLVRRGNVGESLFALLFPGLVKTFPGIFVKVYIYMLRFGTSIIEYIVYMCTVGEGLFALIGGFPRGALILL